MKTYTVMCGSGRDKTYHKITEEGAEIIWKAYTERFGYGYKNMNEREARGGIAWDSEILHWVKNGYLPEDFDWKKYEEMDGILYLGLPYASKNWTIRYKRFQIASIIAGTLMNNGFVVYSPISHGHTIASHDQGGLPGSWEFWRKQCIPFLKRSAVLVVLKIDGWLESIGLQAEIKFAEENNIQIVYIEQCENYEIFLGIEDLENIRKSLSSFL